MGLTSPPASWSQLAKALSMIPGPTLRKVLAIQLEHQPSADVYNFLTRTIELAVIIPYSDDEAILEEPVPPPNRLIREGSDKCRPYPAPVLCCEGCKDRTWKDAFLNRLFRKN